jgi:poly(rC)-binding protein 2/3/4
MEPQQDRTENTPRTRSKARRSATRLALRTGFRNFSGVATVVVGEPDSKLRPETKYLIHKELLTSASPFFAAALNSTFAEGMDQTVRVPEEKPEIFEWFLQWLYTGTLKTPVPRCSNISNGIPSSPIPYQLIPEARESAVHELRTYDVRSDGDLRNSQGSPKYFLLLDMYALSDRLLTSQLTNHILSTIARLSESTNSVPTPSDTWILYDTIRENANIKTLILDLFAYKKTDKLLETHKDEWHPKFLRELCVKLKRPGPEAIERHSLLAWRPADWSTSKACELCKEVLQPGISGENCSACGKVFCRACLRNMGRMNMPNDTSGCKPWTGKGMCVRYHEHAGGEACVMFWV